MGRPGAPPPGSTARGRLGTGARRRPPVRRQARRARDGNRSALPGTSGALLRPRADPGVRGGKRLGIREGDELHDRAQAAGPAAPGGEGGAPPCPAAHAPAVFGIVESWPREKTGAPVNPPELRDYLEAVIDTIR